ncbi:pilin glycosylation ligase domain-containing protein [Candidatus Skiveiella danica]|uniref:pilin glycosylation ligase domain-containing protein n=1 Tax=Candidatus Skiveiella danica TaxID=3386177 RepID=UPI0039B983D5
MAPAPGCSPDWPVPSWVGCNTRAWEAAWHLGSATPTSGEAFGNLRQRNLYASLTSIALCACSGWLATTPGSVGPCA